MTSHRKLKQLIRARSQRTGETYTTARRHVLAQVSAASRLPAAIIAGYPAFGPNEHHESGLLAHVLQAHGFRAPHTSQPYTEAMLAGLGGGIGFMYAVFEYKNMPPLMTIVAQHHPDPWVQAVLGRLEIDHRVDHSGKSDPAIAKMRKALDAGRPVLVALDRSRLPWHGMQPGHGTDPYTVVVAGQSDDLLLIDDEGPVPHEMGVGAFADAWAAYRKGRHQAITIEGGGQTDDLPAAIRAAIATTVAHLTGPVLGHSFDTNFGFSGMRKLAAQLRDQAGKTGWARRFGQPVAFFHGVRRLYDCLEIEYTAPSATRSIYADFLVEAAPLVDPRLNSAADLIRASGRLWSRLATLAQESVEQLGPLTDLAEERLALMFSRGPSAAAEIRELGVRLDALAAEYEASDPLGEQGRRDLFAAMAEIVDECVASETAAVDLLREVV